MIQNQVKLPIGVAFGVVMQGIRIRLGRSLVTLGGIVLGIAFLMSNLSGQVIKEAVQGEDRTRMEARRMASFLAGEMGPPLDRVIGVIQLGILDAAETRLIQDLIDGGLKRLQWHRIDAGLPLPASSGLEPVLISLDDAARDANCVLVLGSGVLPEAFADPAERAKLFAGAHDKIVALTRSAGQLTQAEDVSVVQLMRELSPEEIAKEEQDKRDARFRMAWILTISLVVTVAGISNAMLMSVTERFREIGTMKCLGALSSFIRLIFLMESGLMGALGGIVGAISGASFSVLVYGLAYGFGPVFASIDLFQFAVYLSMSAVAGIVLSIVAAIYPASVAASMVPANALATNV